MALLTDERFTPDHILDLVRAHAPIALDPCTTASNPTKAKKFFTQAHDGLVQSWKSDGLVWVNPPFSRGELPRWVAKVLEEASRPESELVVLTPGDLGTKWAQALYAQATAVAFLHGRLNFARPDGTYDQGAKQSSALWYLGERAQRFERVFQPHASVVYLTRAPGRAVTA